MSHSVSESGEFPSLFPVSVSFMGVPATGNQCYSLSLSSCSKNELVSQGMNYSFTCRFLFHDGEGRKERFLFLFLFLPYLLFFFLSGRGKKDECVREPVVGFLDEDLMRR